MSRQIVLISFTALNAGGGVPRWNRDFVAGFPGTKHYSFDDVLRADQGSANFSGTEWGAANTLAGWLHGTRKISKDDIIISDGFWGEWLSMLGYNVISVAHGIWSHLTKDDVDAGKQPEFPIHHAVQVKHRRDHLARGGKIVAVSDFISNQMKLQWGFDSHVINNAIDLDKFDKLPLYNSWLDERLVIHGVTTANKGFDHIEAVKKVLPNDDVLLLDDAAKQYDLEKYTALKNADLVVQPSAYEGNSYFVLETLACGVPIVAYNVGLLNTIAVRAREKGVEACIGGIIDRKYRSPEETAKVTKFILESVMRKRDCYNPRQVAELFSIQRFHDEWRTYLEDYERHLEGR